MKTLRAGRRDQHGFTLVELLVTLAILGLVMGAVASVYMTGNTIGATGENKAEAQQAARAAVLIEEEMRLAGYGFPLQTTCPAIPTTCRITAASATDMTFWADLLNASTTLSADLASLGKNLSVNSAAGIAAGNAIYLINGDQWASLTVTLPPNVTPDPNTPDTITVQTGPAAAYPRGTQVGRPRAIRYSWSAATQTLSKDAGDGTGLQPLATGVQNLQFRYFDTGDVEIQPVNLALNLGNIRRIQIQVTAQSAAAEHRGTFTMTSSVRPRNL